MFDREEEPVASSGDPWQALADAPPRPRRSMEDREADAEAFVTLLSAPQSGGSATSKPERVADSGPEPRWGATLGDSAVPVSPEIAALREAVAAVAAVDPTQLDPAQALADAAAVVELMQSLKLAALGRVADVEDRKLHRMDGSPTTTSWLREHDSGLTSSDVTLARRLPSLPTVSGAVQRRTLSVTAAAQIAARLAKLRRWLDRPDGRIDGQPAVQTLHAVIVNGVRQLVCQALGGLDDDDPRLVELMADLVEIEQRPESEIARLEAAFVVLAQHVELGLLANALDTLVDALLPNELERRTADAYAHRGFGFRPDFDGSGYHVTDGELDLELGELLHTVLTAMLAADPDSPADTEGYRQARREGWTDADGADGLGPAGPRSRRQRQHDALKRALRLLLDSGIIGLRDKVTPHIGVTAEQDTLHGEPGALPAVGDSGVRLPLSLVREWWCQSSVSRFVMGLGRKVIETSHTERTLKAHERRAKRIETGGRCQAAGCRCGPGEPIIPHHADAFARTGTTSLQDSVGFCRGDHGRLHRGETIRLRDGRLLNENGWVS